MLLEISRHYQILNIQSFNLINLKSNIGVNLFRGFLVFGIVLLPFTSLRFGPLGIGELVLIINFITQRYRVTSISNMSARVISRFWLLFLPISILGFGVHVVFYQMSYGTMISAGFDFLSYIIVFICTLGMEHRLLSNSPHDDHHLSYHIILSMTTAFVLLYIISFYNESIFGLPLRYYIYFAPLVSNTHQAAMVFLPLTFFVLNFINKKKWVVSILIILFSICGFFMCIESGSDKAILGLIIGVLAFILSALFRNFSQSALKRGVIMLIVSLLLISPVFWFQDVSSFLMNSFKSSDGAGARSALYSQVWGLFELSPLVGLGPGPHIIISPPYFSDTHQTFFSAILQGGIIGGFLFIWLVFRVISISFNHPALFAASMSILVYASGGDLLRRLPIWILFVIIIAESNRKSNFKNEIALY